MYLVPGTATKVVVFSLSNLMEPSTSFPFGADVEKIQNASYVVYLSEYINK